MTTPRPLLFGTPGAGKTALLGALAQAAPALKAEVADASGALQQVQTKTYTGQIEPTAGLESYDLRVEPTEKGSDPVSSVNVLDCSGQDAAVMLTSDDPFAKAHALQQPVLAADTVVLAVDASLSGKELAHEFQRFGRWLREFYELRGKRAEVADLPVYLVLTKCDLLAKSDDTFALWMQRIEEAKRKVGEKFRESLSEQTAGFGTIRLQLWATAIKRPALADRPAKGQEPFGVAELFRQCLSSAREFQERAHTAQSRLHNVVAGLIGLIAILAVVVAFLFQFQPDTRSATLEEQARALLPHPDADAVERLQGGLTQLKERQDKLAAIQADPSFDRLAVETRDAVKQLQSETARYIELYEESQWALKLPYLAKNERELKLFEKNANALAVPKEWRETLVGRRAERTRKEYEAVAKAVKEELTWLRSQVKANYALYDQSDAFFKKLRDKKKYDKDELAAWYKLNSAFDTQVRKAPSPPRQGKVPGVTHFRHEDLARLDAIKTARAEWRQSKVLLQERADFILERIAN